MVAFDGRLKNNCFKTNIRNEAATPTSSQPNGDCKSLNESSTKILLTPQIHKDKQTRILIKTGISEPRKIGLNVNTDVHLKPKKKYDSVHFINELLILILTIYGVVSYLEIQNLKGEVQGMKLQIKIMEDPIKLNMEIVNNVLNAIERDRQKDVEMRVTNEVPKHSVAKRDATNMDDIGRIGSNCSSNTRIARSVTRGPLALHLRGALPEITVRDGGTISPWYIDKSSSGSFLLAEGIVGERKGVLEINEEGLYYIYAQIYYLTSSSLNSYAINVQLGEGRGREDSVVAACSAEAAIAKLSELSCFTATVKYLRRGDRLYMTQRERNRRIIFRDNQSFFGLVLLNSHHPVNNK